MLHSVFDILHNSGLPVNKQIEDHTPGLILIRAGSLMANGFMHSAISSALSHGNLTTLGYLILE